MHLEQTRYTFFFTRTSIQHIRSGRDFSRINTEETKTSHIRIDSYFERQSSHRFFWRRFSWNFFIRIIRIMTNDSRRIYRTRQISTNGIQQSLNSFILERRPTKHRNDLHCQSTFTDSSTYFVFRNRSRIIKEFFHQCIITFRSFLKHLFTPFFSLFF